MDGTDCPIEEPQPWWKGWYSHKFHGPGLRYEVAVSLEGDIAHASGPWPCGTHPDLKIFREGGLMQKLHIDEMIIADKGYRGEPEKVWLPGEGNSTQVKAHKFVRSMHETMNGKLKNFKALSTKWRHELSEHPLAFYSVLVITQIGLSSHPLFPIGDKFIRSFV